jgi:hypothetical protein
MRTREEIERDVHTGVNGFRLIIELLLDIRDQNEGLLDAVDPLVEMFTATTQVVGDSVIDFSKGLADKVFDQIFPVSAPHRNELTPQEIAELTGEQKVSKQSE